VPPIPVDLHTGFTLSCMTDPYPRRRADCDEDEEEERDHAAALAKMQGRVPKRAYSLGVLGHTLADRPGYTWRMEEHLYLVPLRGGDSRWGLLRISWDDNECFCQWLDGAREAEAVTGRRRRQGRSLRERYVGRIRSRVRAQCVGAHAQAAPQTARPSCRSGVHRPARFRGVRGSSGR
jgi:hypothetical protein